ncbi:MAG TPA: FAD-dependent oxidoreductase [Pyrinomonadaceae bacterium]|nr:FAD-dependent oxidoreductase [Pyrinomonadaceae bacterium]
MHDVIIIGAGPAGLAAAFWCDELGLDTLVLEQNDKVGGQLLSIYNPIHNYLGRRADDGVEMADYFAAGIIEAEFDLWTNATIETVDLKARRIKLASGEELQSICVIIASGVRRRQLNIPGESQFVGRGMIESGARDAQLFAGKDVCVVGGGDAAAENALLLAEVCPTVTLVHRRKTLRARQEFLDQMQTKHCITVFKEAQVLRILGDERVEAVEILRAGAIKPFQMAVGGVLVRIGVEPNSELFAEQVKVDDQRYIEVDSSQETSIENVFACGDVCSPLAPTISGAVGAGATAAKVIAARLGGGKR